MKKELSRRMFFQSGAMVAGALGAGLLRAEDQGLAHAPKGDDRFEQLRWKGDGPYVGIGQMSLHGSGSIAPGVPLEVGFERQFPTESILYDWFDCRRTIHQPEKFPGNPVLTNKMPWEGRGP